MNDTNTREHDWAVHQLTAYSTGMLPEAQTLRLEEHLLECGDCRARLAPFKAPAAADAGHLPASLIATWPRGSKLLSGIERSLVAQHLESCEACRATLAFAGHEPALSPEAGLVSARRVRFTSKRSTWAWALGLSGVATTAAAWLLVVRPVLFPPGSLTSGTMGSPVRALTAATFEFAVRWDAPGAVDLQEVAPGSAAGGAIVQVALGSEKPGWVLRLPVALRSALPADRDREVSLRLFRGPYEFATGHCRWSELGEAVRIRPERALPEGDYAVQISVAGAAAATPTQVWSWTLRVR